MPTDCENCKANPVDIAETTQGTPTIKLVAILIAQGITDTKRLAQITGLKIRAVQAARNALQCAQQNASAQHTAPKAQQDAPNAAECAQHTAPLARAYKESLRDTFLKEDSVSQPAREGFNEATEAMVADVLTFMGPIARDHEARRWLTGTIAAYGAERTSRAWTIVTAKRATGQPVPNPLALWSKTALGLKDAPKTPAPASADVLPFKVTVAMHPNARPRDEVMGTVNA
jgi:hypothetical protein